MDELAALNSLCRDLYEGMDPAVRQRAEQNLTELAESPECLRRCMMLLSQGDFPYGPMVASTTLMKILSGKSAVTAEQKLELVNFVLNMLAQGAPTFPNFLVTSLCQLFARLTKQEWTYRTSEGSPAENDHYPFRDPIKFLLESININQVQESMLALQLLSLLVVDMNSGAGMESVNKHRKCLSQFRDAYLHQIYTASIDFLKENCNRSFNQQEMTLVNGVLELCLHCLNFDFIGSLTDETSDDNCNVQIPTSWRNSFTDGKVIDLMFEFYHKLAEDSSKTVLSIIAQLASIRRTLFNGSERQMYVQKILDGVLNVIQNPSKLSDQDTFHEFCRLIARLKTNYQLCELISASRYADVVAMLADFTIKSLRVMEFSVNGTYYLMTFWQRMVTSVPYVKSNEEHLLNVYCPQIMAAFVESRLRNVERIVRENADDPLEDIGSTLQMMEHVAILSRLDYQATYELLARHLEENANIWMRGSRDDPNVQIAEGRLVWLITLTGTAVFGKTTVNPSDDDDKRDGDLMSTCIQLMQFNDNRLRMPQNLGELPANGNFRLEISFIHMLEQFRRAYIADQIPRVSAVYEQLTAKCGISEERDMLGVIIDKILTNLRFWPTHADLLDLSLSLMRDLSLGYTAVKRLFRLQQIQMLLKNHTAENFAFLGPMIEYSTMKQRTVFYESLVRLLVSDSADDEEVFLNFMNPIQVTVKGICDVISNNSQGIDEERFKRIIVGLCRDLRGISSATSTKPVFQALFNWMYPDVFNIMTYSVEKWCDRPEVTVPIMRLLSDMACNRQNRLKFDMGSCMTVLFFREVSKIICVYGNNMLALPKCPEEQAYKLRYKNISIIYYILKNALMGAYVPFGVFRLYGDTCLHDALSIFIKFFMIIPEDDFLSYTKLAQNYYNLLEHVMQENMAFLTNLSPDVFCAILRSIHAGINALDAIVITSACSSLDSTLNYLYRRLTRGSPSLPKAGDEPEGDSILRAVKSHPEILAEILRTLLSMMMYGEVKCQWSVSRPMLGLILIQEEVYENLKRDLTAQHSFARQEQFAYTFQQLMSGVEQNLSVKNKDVFTHNLSKFRRDFAEILRGRTVIPQTANALQNNEMICFRMRIGPQEE